jgi:hypothetical protein
MHSLNLYVEITSRITAIAKHVAVVPAALMLGLNDLSQYSAEGHATDTGSSASKVNSQLLRTLL